MFMFLTVSRVLDACLYFIPDYLKVSQLNGDLATNEASACLCSKTCSAFGGMDSMMIHDASM